MSQDLFQRILAQFIPSALEFVSQEENRQVLEFIAKATDSMPVLDPVEYDPDTGEVYIKIKLTPKLGVNIEEYANAVDKVAQQFVNMISAFITSSQDKQ